MWLKPRIMFIHITNLIETAALNPFTDQCSDCSFGSTTVIDCEHVFYSLRQSDGMLCPRFDQSGESIVKRDSPKVGRPGPLISEKC